MPFPTRSTLILNMLLLTVPLHATPDAVALRDYLIQTGDRFDCFFTVEGLREGALLANPLLCMKITRPAADVDSLESWTSSLSAMELPHPIRVMTTQCQGTTIIHIVDERLVGRAGYPMDTQISVTFQGTPVHLLQHLAESGFRVRSPAVTISNMGYCDVSTPLTIEATQTSIREVLSNYLPFGSYNRLLWSSLTDLSETGGTCEVQYCGPRSKRK